MSSGIDPEELDEFASRLLAAVVAVIEFGRPIDDSGDQLRLFEAATVEALVSGLAGWIVHPHQDEEQHDELLEAVVSRLRGKVAEFGK